MQSKICKELFPSLFQYGWIIIERIENQASARLMHNNGLPPFHRKILFFFGK